MHETEEKSDVAVLLGYAGSHKRLNFLGLILSAVSMLLGMAPYICIWLVARELITVAPDWTAAQSVTRYGWLAFATAVGGIVLYFLGLMCTHLAAFRTAANIRKQGVTHMMEAPLGFFDANASGLIRGRLDAAAADTETLLAHNLADIVGTMTLFIAVLVLMFVFDWRMGCACLLAAVISILSMFTMMGGKNAQLMAEYQAAQDRMTKAGTEYVRGIPVVKIFQQTVWSFKAFQQAIEEYSAKAEYYQGDVCRTPQSVNLTITEGAFMFLVPAALFLAPGALNDGGLAGFITDFAFYAVFSAIISTALARIMFASSGMMLAHTALGRIAQVMDAPTLPVPARPQMPQSSRIAFQDVSFTYYLSGGEQQRIALARAILKDASIVVLDEATAFADPENEALIQKAFTRLTRGRTVIMIAHRLSTVVGADKIFVLSEGQILEQGTHEELTAAGGLYTKMWIDYNRAIQWKIAGEKEAE